MGTRSIWSRPAESALEQGPVARADLVRIMSASVPPARAIAAVERARHGTRKHQERKHGRVVRECPERSKDDVMVGAHAVAILTVRNRLRNGTWVKLPDGRIATREWVEQHQSD